MKHGCKNKFAKLEHGQALVELALVLPLFLLLLFGVFEFGRAFYINNSLYYATSVAVRKASMTPIVTDIEKVGKDEVIAAAGSFGLTVQEAEIVVCVPGVKTASCGTAPGTIANDPISVRIDRDFSTGVSGLLPMLVNVLLDEEAFSFYANQDAVDRSGYGRIPNPNPSPNNNPPPRTEGNYGDMEGQG